MLEKVFWTYFKNTGNIDAYLVSKELVASNQSGGVCYEAAQEDKDDEIDELE